MPTFKEAAISKWAMVGYKGGLCVACGERVTSGNIKQFHFDHKIPLNNAGINADRWGGGVRYWTPFTDKWFAWAARVDLICEDCHVKKHKQKTQKCLLEYLEFVSVQKRLEQHECSPVMLKQLKFDMP